MTQTHNFSQLTLAKKATTTKKGPQFNLEYHHQKEKCTEKKLSHRAINLCDIRLVHKSRKKGKHLPKSTQKYLYVSPIPCDYQAILHLSLSRPKEMAGIKLSLHLQSDVKKSVPPQISSKSFRLYNIFQMKNSDRTTLLLRVEGGINSVLFMIRRGAIISF